MLSVGSELELRTTLQHIVDGAAELTGARYAALGTTDPGQDGLTEIRTGGAEPPPAGVLSVPIHVHDQVFGHLHLAGKQHSAAFTAEDEQLLHVLAAQAGSRSATPACTRRPGSANAGSRARRPSPPLCSPASGRPTRWPRSRRAPGHSPTRPRA